jgi:hypothetical protein
VRDTVATVDPKAQVIIGDGASERDQEIPLWIELARFDARKL